MIVAVCLSIAGIAFGITLAFEALAALTETFETRGIIDWHDEDDVTA